MTVSQLEPRDLVVAEYDPGGRGATELRTGQAALRDARTLAGQDDHPDADPGENWLAEHPHVAVGAVHGHVVTLRPHEQDPVDEPDQAECVDWSPATEGTWPRRLEVSPRRCRAQEWQCASMGSP